MDEILKLSFAFESTPFGYCASPLASETINTLTFKYNSAPFWALSAAPVMGHIKSINGVAWEHIKSYCGIDQAHIKTAMGVEG